MAEEMARIVGERVAEAVDEVDSQVHSAVLAVWSRAGPGPDCPTLGDAAKEIAGKCHWGLREREKVARAALRDTVAEIGTPVSGDVAEATSRAIARQFPEDQYVRFVENTRGVFQRAQAPTNKMSTRAFDLQLGLAKAASANLGRRSIRRIQTDLDAMRARDAGNTNPETPRPLPWQAANWVGKHLMTIGITVIAGVCVAALSAYLGFG